MPRLSLFPANPKELIYLFRFLANSVIAVRVSVFDFHKVK